MFGWFKTGSELPGYVKQDVMQTQLDAIFSSSKKAREYKFKIDVDGVSYYTNEYTLDNGVLSFISLGSRYEDFMGFTGYTPDLKWVFTEHQVPITTTQFTII